MAEFTEGSQPPQEDSQWQTAKGRVESVVRSQNPDKDPEKVGRLIDLTKEKLELLSQSPKLKVIVQGELRTIELPDSETPVAGLNLETINSLFDLGFEPHNINRLDPNDVYFQTISDGLGKPLIGRIIENGVTDKGPFQPTPRVPAS